MRIISEFTKPTLFYLTEKLNFQKLNQQVQISELSNTPLIIPEEESQELYTEQLTSPCRQH